MLFAKNLNLNNINPEWVEKRSGFRKLAEVPIRFVPVVSSYDTDQNNSNSFSLVWNKSGEEVIEKEYKKEE